MDESKLQKIQDEIMSEMNKETNAEALVNELSEEIAAKLETANKTTAEINEREYSFAYRYIDYKGRKGLMMTVGDISKFRLLQEKYRPYSVTAEIDNDFTLRENLKSVVEAFLRHVMDLVKAEEI